MAEPLVVFMTGCAGGIGSCIADRLVRAGHQLVLSDVNDNLLAAEARRRGWHSAPNVRLQALDVRDDRAWNVAIDEIIANHGRLDLLLNVAGYMSADYVTDSAGDAIDLHMDINAKGLMFGARAAARHMVRQRSGHIVNLASLTSIAPVAGLGLYSASKHAVRGFSLALAQELRPHGVYVTAVCPDAVDTRMLSDQLPNSAAKIAFSGPRPLKVDEIADVVVGKVLRDRPIEVTLAPRGSGRVFASRLVSLIPSLAVLLGPIVSRIGERSQAKLARAHS
jgi:3-oxoacyl-[acyl-carrier protein] reductase